MKVITKLFITLSLVLIGYISSAQEEFVFSYDMMEMEEVQSTIGMKEHYLGEEFTLKMQLLKEAYTYKVKDEISKTEKVEIEKPSIYYSVKKTDKYLKKALRKGKVTEDEAKETLNNILNVALNVRYQDTQKFEDLLWDIKDPVQISSLYTERVKLEM